MGGGLSKRLLSPQRDYWIAILFYCIPESSQADWNVPKESHEFQRIVEFETIRLDNLHLFNRPFDCIQFNFNPFHLDILMNH